MRHRGYVWRGASLGIWRSAASLYDSKARPPYFEALVIRSLNLLGRDALRLRKREAVYAHHVVQEFLEHLAESLVPKVIGLAHQIISALSERFDMFLGGQPDSDWLQWGWVATGAACMIWDADSLALLSTQHIDICRESGALAQLVFALDSFAMVAVWRGDFEAATALMVQRNEKAHTGIRQGIEKLAILANV
jgi:hypothetical protein